MEINYTLSQDDYINFNIYHGKNSKSIKRNLNLQRFATPLLFFVFAFIANLKSDIPLWYWLVIFSVIYVIWTIFYPKYYFYTVKKGVSKMINEGKNEDLIGNKTLKLRDDHILSISDNSESKVKWNTVERYVETDRYIFIYISAVSAYIIPKEDFDSEEKKDKFITILNKKITSL